MEKKRLRLTKVRQLFFSLSIRYSLSVDRHQSPACVHNQPPEPSSALNILIPQPPLRWDQLTLCSYTEQLSLLMCFFNGCRSCSCRLRYRLSVKCLQCVL